MTKKTHSTAKEQKKETKSTKIQSWISDKERISHNFIENTSDYRNLLVYQGDIYTCEIGENIGEEQCNSRPVLVLSKSFYNHKSSQVTVVPLSETVQTKVVVVKGQKKTKMKTRTHYLLRKSDFNFLNEDSAVKCEQIRSISKARLTRKLGSIDQRTLKAVQNRVTDLLDL